MNSHYSHMPEELQLLRRWADMANTSLLMGQGNFEVLMAAGSIGVGALIRETERYLSSRPEHLSPEANAYNQRNNK